MVILNGFEIWKGGTVRYFNTLEIAQMFDKFLILMEFTNVRCHAHRKQTLDHILSHFIYNITLRIAGLLNLSVVRYYK
jgi:hypothetical protein